MSGLKKILILGNIANCNVQIVQLLGEDVKDAIAQLSIRICHLKNCNAHFPKLEIISSIF